MDAGVLIIGFLLVVMALTFVMCCGLGILFIGEVFKGYGEVLRRLRRHPRFGIGALFTVTTIFAAAAALFRWMSNSSLPAETWFQAILALVMGLGAGCAAQFVASDLCDSWSRRQSWPLQRRFSEECAPCSTEEVPQVSTENRHGTD